MQPLTPTQLAAQNPKFLGIAQDYFRPLIASSVLDDFCLAIAAFVSYAHEDCLLWNPLHDLAAKGGLKHPLNHLQTLQKSEAFLGLLTPDLLHLTSKLKPAMDATDNALANLKDFTKFEVGTLYRGQLESFDTLELAYECAKSYGLDEMWDKDDQVIITEDNVPIDAFRPTSEFREISHTNSCQLDTHRVTLDSQATEETQMPATVATVEATVKPEIAKMSKTQAKKLFTEAAQDNRIINIIEDLLMNETFDATLTDDLVYACQEYIALPDPDNKKFLHETSKAAGLKLPTDFCKSVENSPAFQTLLGEYLSKVPQQQTIVATDTTAQTIANESKPPKPSKAPKTPKAKQKLPMPSIASIEALESMSRPELSKAIQALNSNISTSTRGNSATKMMAETLAFHVLGLKDYKFPSKQKPAKAPKTPKAKKPVEVIALPEGLSWDEVKGMKYRALQQLGKAFRSQGHTMPRLNSKGDDIKAAIAEAMRSMGHDIQTAEFTPANTAELHLPNFSKMLEEKRLERLATEALRMDATDAKVHMELAVAR